MIFLTVGSQMPFDRLVKHVDDWAFLRGVEGLAQIGNSAMQTRALKAAAQLAPDAFNQAVAACDLLIGHAGMGTVLTGLEFGKPMILFPRLGGLRETRNDHQVATLRWLADRPGIHPAFDEAELTALLVRVSAGEQLTAPGPADECVNMQRLVRALKEFIGGE